MISLKRVLAADTVQVVRRIDWVSPEETTGGLGFTYDMYRHDYSPSKTAASGATKLYDSDFYVVNSQYQVYKCIYNGTSPSDPNGKPSTVELLALPLASLLLVMDIVGSICTPSLLLPSSSFSPTNTCPSLQMTR